MKQDRIYDIGCGKETSVNELFRLVKQALGVEGTFQYAPPRSGDVRYSCADITKATRDLDYKPKIDLLEGLRLTVKCMKN